MTIGAKIAACRKRAGMSQEKLANELTLCAILILIREYIFIGKE